MSRRLLIAGLLMSPGAAHAAREPFYEVLDSEVLPARAAELQSRVTDTIGPTASDGETALWWGGALGLSHSVQLLLPAEIAVSHETGTTRFTWYAAELRWRIRKPGPPPGPGQPVPLLRLVVERSIAKRSLEAGLDLVVATDLSSRVHTSFMLGGTAVSTADEVVTHAGLGITTNATQSLRVGAEVFTEVPLVPELGAPTVAAGPDLSLTIGPYWVTGSGLVGVGRVREYTASFRLAWGVEF